MCDNLARPHTKLIKVMSGLAALVKKPIESGVFKMHVRSLFLLT